MTKVIAVINQKGGVGKTTTAANIAYAWAKEGYDVLAIDFDSQASLTNYLNVGVDDEGKYYWSVYELLIAQLRGLDPEEYEGIEFTDGFEGDVSELNFEDLLARCIHRPTYPDRVVVKEDGKKKFVDVQKEFGFDLLPSNINLSDYELEIGNLPAELRAGNGYRLYDIIQDIIAWHNYDYIIIDCNPSLGVMAMNALAAATDGVLIPTNLDLMSTRGVNTLIGKIADVQSALLNSTGGRIKHMGVIGVVLNLYSERRSVDRTIQTDLERFYPFRIFNSTIPESSNAKKALFAGMIYSQVYPKAEAAYDALAKEINERIEEMNSKGQQILRIGDEPGEI